MLRYTIGSLLLIIIVTFVINKVLHVLMVVFVSLVDW